MIGKKNRIEVIENENLIGILIEGEERRIEEIEDLKEIKGVDRNEIDRDIMIKIEVDRRKDERR